MRETSRIVALTGCSRPTGAGRAGIEMMRALLANQGPAGSLGYLQAFRRPGRHERTIVVPFGLQQLPLDAALVLALDLNSCLLAHPLEGGIAHALQPGRDRQLEDREVPTPARPGP